MINLDFTEHPVMDIRMVDHDLFEVILERQDLRFTPGDCVALYTDDGKSRPYSIASGSEEPELRFLIRHMYGGEVSPWLMSRRPGHTIRITQPFGWFRPGQEIGGAPFVFLATGTGIAPFLSYMHTFEERPLLCLYGVRRAADAIGFSTFSNYCPTRLCVSRETAPGHHHGRITDLLDILPIDPRTHYYCCGLESMVNEVAGWLVDRGTDLRRIHREVFFHG